MRLYLLILLFVLCSCGNANIQQPTRHKAKIEFSDKYIVCASCSSTILVRHDECTFCGQIHVDSGTIYIPNKILQMLDTLKDKSDQSDTLYVPHNVVSLRELYFADSNYYERLWPTGSRNNNSSKFYRLTGKIVDVRRRILQNGVIEAYPVLFFDVVTVQRVKK